MYLWKYWRESRIVFGAAVLVIAVLFVEVLREPIDRTAGLQQLVSVLPFFLLSQSTPLGFLGWYFGSFGIGRDLGEKSGSFICSRPKHRSYFVWCDWACGIAQLFIVVVLANMVLWFQIHRVLLSTGDLSHGRIPFSDGTTLSLIYIVCVTCTIVFLLVALVFSLTYFSTIVLGNVRGIIYGAGILMGYLVLAERVRHYWPAAAPPSLVLQQYAFSRGIVIGIADHLGPAIAIRAGVVLLFPFAAQFLLKKIDI